MPKWSTCAAAFTRSPNRWALAPYSPAARAATAYLHSIRSDLRTPNGRYVRYVRYTLSLIF